MQIPDEIRKCVAFVACEKPVVGDAFDKVILGTGFLVGVKPDGVETHVPFFVTARHVVDDAQ